MSSTYMAALANAFQERLTPGIQDLLIENDPFFENMIETSMGVTRDPISKDWKIYWNYMSSLAGGAIFVTGPGDASTDSLGLLENTAGATVRTNIINSLTSFPGARDSAIPTVGRYSVKLAQVHGNITLPMSMLQMNALDAALNDQPAEVMRKHIEMLAHLNACTWYMNTSGGLAQLNTASTCSASGSLVTVTTASGNLVVDGRIRRLKPGMYVDVYSSAFAKVNTNSFVLITGVINYQNGTTSIVVYVDHATDLSTLSTSSNWQLAWLVPRGGISTNGTGYSRMPCGYQAMLIASGTLYGTNFGDLSITNAPEKASIVAAVSADLTESVLNQYLDQYNAALSGAADTALTSSGVLLNLLDNPTTNNWNAYQRQGEPLRLRLGFAKGTSYSYDGKDYTIYTSPYITKGHFVLFKRANGNIQRVSPPAMSGVGLSPGRSPAAFSNVQWIGPMFFDSIWMPTLSTTGYVSTGAQAPYLFITQTIMNDTRGLLLTGCTDNSLGT